MDAQKVIEVANLYLAQFGHHLTDETRADFQGVFEAGKLQTTKEELSVLLARLEKEVAANYPVVAKSFPKERRLPTTNEAVAHFKAMIPQMRQFILDGHIAKCCRWSGFMCLVVPVIHEPVVNYEIASLAAEAAVTLALAGQLNDAFFCLGCAQSALWVSGAYSIGELKDHSKPASAP